MRNKKSAGTSAEKLKFYKVLYPLFDSETFRVLGSVGCELQRLLRIADALAVIISLQIFSTDLSSCDAAFLALITR